MYLVTSWGESLVLFIATISKWFFLDDHKVFFLNSFSHHLVLII